VNPNRLEPQQLLAGDVRTLAQSLSLAESAQEGAAAEELAALLCSVVGRRDALRISIAGPPGVGKSSLINRLGASLCAAYRSVAVLAVDPSSSQTGGAILGDKVRMTELADNENAFVRSVACRLSGGVSAGWHESILLCEAAGFDVIVTETMGVGQGEIASSFLADIYVLVVSPGLGDQIQGIKRGVLELADLVVVTKADGPTEELAKATVRDYEQAMSQQNRSSLSKHPQVIPVSAKLGQGIDELIAILDAIDERHAQEDHATARRRGLRAWTSYMLVEEFARMAGQNEDSNVLIESALDELVNGRVTVPSVTRDILTKVFGGRL
jgi:LAO/AO transport system kinase